jgi:hypothetical protein
VGPEEEGEDGEEGEGRRAEEPGQRGEGGEPEEDAVGGPLVQVEDLRRSGRGLGRIEDWKRSAR